jgi:hypothetical protein
VAYDRGLEQDPCDELDDAFQEDETALRAYGEEDQFVEILDEKEGDCFQHGTKEELKSQADALLRCSFEHGEEERTKGEAW